LFTDFFTSVLLCFQGRRLRVGNIARLQNLVLWSDATSPLQAKQRCVIANGCSLFPSPAQKCGSGPTSGSIHYVSLGVRPLLTKTVLNPVLRIGIGVVYGKRRVTVLFEGRFLYTTMTAQGKPACSRERSFRSP
jgi:hypothetical protein